ncbi:MAG: paraquat-inducible protein A [Proteobacteria bacterium]|nr:MAG: paraquat-inducible protein A [Pseudomonadota bacterium]PIE68085.1 MAG: paraquat-inducible protein A [Deltaproteobacteria bacterium]
MTQPLIACHECDLLHRMYPLPTNSKACCIRCGAVLYSYRPETIDRTLALSLAGLALLVVANLYPFLSLASQGTVLETTLVTGTIILAQQNMSGVAVLVLFTSMLLPCMLLLSLVYVLGPLRMGRRLPADRRMFRLALSLRPWSMTEIFLLGILVSVVKLAKMAAVIPGIALFAFLGLVFVLATVNTWMEPHTIWEKMDSRE